MENGWHEYQKLVLSDLQRLNTQIEHLTEKVDDLTKATEVLKIKTNIWWALAASVPGFGALILFFLGYHG